MKIIVNNFYSTINDAGWLFSEEANNFGAFMSGCCEFILVGLAIWTFIFGIRRWQKEKRAERISLIAEEALNHLESCLFMAKTWLDEIYFVYSCRSSASTAQYHAATAEEKLNLQNMHKTHPYEISNYCRSCKAIINEFIIAKNRAARLEDTEINNLFDGLGLVLKLFPPRLARLHNEQCPTNEKNEAHKFLEEEAPEKLNEFFESIKTHLYKRLKFENKITK